MTSASSRSGGVEPDTEGDDGTCPQSLKPGVSRGSFHDRYRRGAFNVARGGCGRASSVARGGTLVVMASAVGSPAPLLLSLPDTGVTDGAVLLRTPVVDDVDALLPSFADPELREAGNLPNVDRAQMLAMLPQL